MSKKEFMEELRKRLSNLPKSEAEKSMGYYQDFNKSFETFRKICYNQVGDFHLTNLTKAGIIL